MSRSSTDSSSTFVRLLPDTFSFTMESSPLNALSSMVEMLLFSSLRSSKLVKVSKALPGMEGMELLLRSSVLKAPKVWKVPCVMFPSILF